MAGTNAADITATHLMPLIRAWRLDETKPVACPACNALGLAIADRSARPYREWYALSCAACGFEKTAAVSLGAPVPGAD